MPGECRQAFTDMTIVNNYPTIPMTIKKMAGNQLDILWVNLNRLIFFVKTINAVIVNVLSSVL
jgi:hypothetical protein